MKFIGEYIVKNYLTHTSLAAAMLATMFTTTGVQAEDAFMEALKGGKVDFSFRTRYEYVDDASRGAGLEEAEALTARTTLGYKTGSFHDFFFYGQFENVTAILSDAEYNDCDGGCTAAGNNTTLPVIADPKGTEVNQAYVGYNVLDKGTIKVGRQIITPRKAPFHRFLGTVLWRQNWQTHDAITFTGSPFKDTKLIAGYIWNNNTIFGSDRDMEAPIVNFKYTGLPVKLEAYYYDLKFSDAPALSNTTFGIRGNGAYPISDSTKLIYTAEFATQEEGNNATTAYDANYYLVEGGFKTKFKDSFIKSLMAKVSYEVLESDNGVGFKTPLATGHAYQGWADKFLATPAGGIEDTYFTAVATGPYATKLIVSYHMLEAETGSFDYGDELDIWLTKKFAKKYTVGIKYSDYDASSDAGNVGGPSNDITKFWAYFAFKF